MSENQANGQMPDDAAAPSINCLAQYIKDLSFENPNAPRSLEPQSVAPPINIQVNVNAKQLSEHEYEVDLIVEGQGGEAPNLLFNVELTYGGIFRLQNIPQEHIHPVLMIESPRLLFPFARQIVAEAVRNGGFPPLYLEPIDFNTLYQQRMAEAAGNA